MLDTDWIPQVAARGCLIITRDSMIIQNRNEIAGVRENKAKMVLLHCPPQCSSAIRASARAAVSSSLIGADSRGACARLASPGP